MHKTSNRKPTIAIAGAGPAGSSIAILLSKAGFNVSLVEKAAFPRHKLCGEFVSPECLSHFEELGVSEKLHPFSSEKIVSTTFYSLDGASASVPTKWFSGGEFGAIGLSRYTMDEVLFRHAEEAGAEVLEECAVKGVTFDGETPNGFLCKGKDGEVFELASDILVDATGRGASIVSMARKERGLGIKPEKPKWVGFKAHFAGTINPPGVCEIYFFNGGYGGVNFVENGDANVCFLVRSDVAREYGGDAGAVFEKCLLENPRAAEVLGSGKQSFAWIAVSVPGFGMGSPANFGNMFAVGDAASFIDPFTGSGILLALESGKLFSQAAINSADYKNISDVYTRLYRKEFTSRLKISSMMRTLANSEKFTNVGVKTLSRITPLLRLLARGTRGGVFRPRQT